MAKNRPTPLKDEPISSFDEMCSKIDTLIETINRQNGFLQVIAQKGGFDSEYNFIVHQFNATSAIHEALVKYLKENKAEIVVDGEEDDKLAKAEELLNKYQALLAEAMEIIKNHIFDTSPVTTVVIHEPLPTKTVLKPQPPQSTNGMFTYIFLHLPWYYIRNFFTSSYFKHWLIIIMVSVWFVSVFLTCIMAIDNVRMYQMYNTILIHSGI